MDERGARTTVARGVETTGTGLHSGRPVRLALRPAPPETGLVFRRVDLPGGPEVPATDAAIGDARNATTLVRGDAHVTTVEHLLAALAMARVDDAVIELDAPEPPAGDGSARPFVEWIDRAGLRRHGGPRAVATVVAPVSVREGDREIEIVPAPRFGVEYAIDFAAPAIGRQSLALDPLDAAAFRAGVAGARTFGFLEDVSRLRAAGLARGASPANTLVVDGERVLCDEPLRWPDEFVRHKVLDLVGDLSLHGRPLVGLVRVRRGGHALHHALLRALRERPGHVRVGSGAAACA